LSLHDALPISTNFGDGPQTERLDLLGASQHERRRAVIERRRIGRRHRTAALEYGPEARYLIEIDRADLLVLAHQRGLAFAPLNFDGHDLPIKLPGSLGRLRPLIGRHCVGSLLPIGRASWMDGAD